MFRVFKDFYGWVIVLAGFIIAFAGLGVVNSMNGVLIKPICDDLGFARGEFTLRNTIMTLVGAVLLPVFGKIYSKIGVKKVLLVSTIAIAILTFAYSFATEIWHFYLIALLNGIFMSGPGFMTIGYLINNWFDDKRGFATGIAYAGAGIGSAVFIPIVSAIAESSDWRSVFQFSGIAVLVILLPTVLFLIKEKPQDVGQTPYRDKKNSGEILEERRATGMTFAQAIRTPAFWMILLSIFLLSIMAGGPNINSVPYLTDIGYSASFASIVMSLLMVAHMLGNVSLGGFFDKFGMLIGSVFLGVCCIVFPILALSAAQPAFIWIYILFYGPASAGFAVPVALFVSTYFGRKDFAPIFSVLTMTAQIGTAVAGPSMSLIYDQTGNYTGAWLMLLGFGVVISICLVGAYLLRKKAHHTVVKQ